MNWTKAVCLCLALALLMLLPACGGQSAPSAASAPEPVDMQAVYEQISAKVELPEMVELSAKRMDKYYGIDTSACPQAVTMVNEAGMSVDEIWLIEAASDEEAQRIEAVAKSRIEQLCAETEKYSAELYAVAKNGQVVRDGAKVALFISPDAETMASIFRQAVGK